MKPNNNNSSGEDSSNDSGSNDQAADMTNGSDTSTNDDSCGAARRAPCACRLKGGGGVHTDARFKPNAGTHEVATKHTPRLHQQEPRVVHHNGALSGLHAVVL